MTDQSRVALSNDFAKRAETFSNLNLLVMGDVMLDRYWFGEVSRISPEAPVPVVHINKMEERPGGAANVARNIAALNTPVSIVSVIGDDEAGSCVERLLAHEHVKSFLHRDTEIQTTIKLRVIGRQQQLLRIDFETKPTHEVLLSAFSDFKNALNDCGVVILSDYGKGGLAHVEEIIDACNQAHKPVLVDPKGDDYARYRNATMLTPNRSEFREVVGSWKNQAEFDRKAQALRTELNLQGLLITRSEEGMSLYTQQETLHVPAHAKEVYDVSGAGDTVIATLGVMLASGADMAQAVQVANQAAAIVVGKLGTAVVHIDELMDGF